MYCTDHLRPENHNCAKAHVRPSRTVEHGGMLYRWLLSSVESVSMVVGVRMLNMRASRSWPMWVVVGKESCIGAILSPFDCELWDQQGVMPSIVNMASNLTRFPPRPAGH